MANSNLFPRDNYLSRALRFLFRWFARTCNKFLSVDLINWFLLPELLCFSLQQNQYEWIISLAIDESKYRHRRVQYRLKASWKYLQWRCHGSDIIFIHVGHILVMCFWFLEKCKQTMFNRKCTYGLQNKYTLTRLCEYKPRVEQKLLLVFSCFQQPSQPVWLASLPTALPSSSCHLRSIHHFPVVDQSTTKKVIHVILN